LTAGANTQMLRAQQNGLPPGQTMTAAVPSSEAWRRRLEIPAYRVGEAARYVGLAPQTVTAWHRTGVRQTLSAKERRNPLTYLQLIEVAVVAAARNAGVRLDNIRRTRDYISRQFGSKFPFAEYRFKTDGEGLFIDQVDSNAAEGQETVLRPDRGGQLAWRAIIGRLDEFEYDEIVHRWHVAGRDSAIVIDPRIAFGKPSVGGIATWVLRGRADAGESVPDIADDFGLAMDDVRAAIEFERRSPDPARRKTWVH